MGLIDRYVYAVTKRLPQAQREDIERELRGLIDDMLSERCAGEEPKISDIEAVLKEIGEPSQLADKYRDTKSYLIGPEFFDMYMLVLKIAIPVTVFAVAVVDIIQSLVDAPSSMIQGLGGFIESIISAGFSSFTWVTVIFAVSERFRQNNRTEAGKREWDPSTLPEIPSENAIIKRSEPMVGIIFTILFIIVLNFADQLLGAYRFENGEFVSVIPIFSGDGLRQFMPLITVLFCLSILKECVKLIVGRWTLWLGAASAVLSIAGLILCIIIFSAPTIWNTGFINEMYAAGIVPAGMLSDLNIQWGRFGQVFIYFVAVTSIIDAAVSIYKGIKYRL